MTTQKKIVSVNRISPAQLIAIIHGMVPPDMIDIIGDYWDNPNIDISKTKDEENVETT